MLNFYLAHCGNSEEGTSQKHMYSTPRSESVSWSFLEGAPHTCVLKHAINYYRCII